LAVKLKAECVKVQLICCEDHCRGVFVSLFSFVKQIIQNVVC